MTGKEIGSILLALLATTAAPGAVGAAAIGPSPADTGSGNEPPLADAGLDQTVTVDESVLLDGGGSRDPDGEITTYRWEITGPGSSTVAPDCPTCERTTFVPADSGVYEVELAVTDDDDVTRSDTLFVTAERADGPSVSLDGPARVTEGNQARYRASIDAGDASLDGVVWRVGASVVSRENLSGRHGEAQLRRTFDDPGTIEVSVTAVDEAGRDASAGMDVAVDPDGGASPGTPPDPQNEEPTVTIEGPDLVEPGDYEEFTAVASDPDGVIVDYEWSNAETTVMTDPTRAGRHFSEGPGRLVPITVTAEDDDGGTATDTTVVRINRTPTASDNRPPEVSLDAPDSVEACMETEVTLTADADDPDGDSIQRYTWSGVDTADGRSAGLFVDGSDKSPEVSVKAEDEHGAITTKSAAIEVVCNRPQARVNGLSGTYESGFLWWTEQSNIFEGDASFRELEEVNFEAEIQNPSKEPLDIRWEFGDGTTAWEEAAGETTVKLAQAHQYRYVVDDSHQVRLPVSITIYRGGDPIDSVHRIATVEPMAGNPHDEIYRTLEANKTSINSGDGVKFTVRIGARTEGLPGVNLGENNGNYFIDFPDGKSIPVTDFKESTPSEATAEVTTTIKKPGSHSIKLRRENTFGNDGPEGTLDEVKVFTTKRYTVYDWNKKDHISTTDTQKSWSDPGHDWEWDSHVRTTEKATGETTVQPAHMPSPPRGDGYYWKKIDSFTRYGWPHEEFEKYETASLDRYEKTTIETVRGDQRRSLSRPRTSEVYGDSLSSTEYECSNANAPLHDEAC